MNKKNLSKAIVIMLLALTIAISALPAFAQQATQPVSSWTTEYLYDMDLSVFHQSGLGSFLGNTESNPNVASWNSAYVNDLGMTIYHYSEWHSAYGTSLHFRPPGR